VLHVLLLVVREVVLVSSLLLPELGFEFEFEFEGVGLEVEMEIVRVVVVEEGC